MEVHSVREQKKISEIVVQASRESKDGDERGWKKQGLEFSEGISVLGEFPRDTETYLSRFLREPIKPRLDSPAHDTARYFTDKDKGCFEMSPLASSRPASNPRE